MKNVTLSLPDKLLDKSRDYAQSQGTTLNEMIRTLLKKTINSEKDDFLERLKEFQKEIEIDTTVKFNREELYER